MPQSDQIVIQCPACGGKLRAPRSTIGATVGCPNCQAAVVVREPAPVAMIVDPSRKLGTDPRSQTSPVGEADFKDRFRSTSESGFKVDPEQPVMKRRDHRRDKHAGVLTEWDLTSKRRSSRTRSKHLIPILALVAGLATVALTIIFWQRLVPEDQPGHGGGAAGSLPLELQPVGDFRDQIWEVARQFASAPTAGDAIPFIRNPEQVGPRLLKYYTSDNPWIPFSLARKPDLTNLVVDRNFVVFDLPLADHGVRPMAFEQTADGFRVDWESFTGYSELSWVQLRRQRPRMPVMLRAVVRMSDYFNMDFPSPETHRCFQLSDQHSDHTLYGYVTKGSEADVQMAQLMLKAPSVHAILRVRYPETSTSDRQMEITEVLEKGWVLREEHLPEKTVETSPPETALPPVQSTPGSDPKGRTILPGLNP